MNLNENLEKADRKVLCEHFSNLIEIMKNDGEKNWIRGIEEIYEGLKTINTKPLSEIAYSYRLMNSGNGSFMDYFIWKEDFNERVKANECFKKLTTEIWDILNKY